MCMQISIKSKLTLLRLCSKFLVLQFLWTVLYKSDLVQRISFAFLKWRRLGPQKLTTIIGHKYSIV